jgi:uridine phosphorylase
MRLPILGVEPSELPDRVLVVGDPARAATASTMLDDARVLAHNREYAVYAGGHRGVEVAVVSHGVGGPGAGVCFEELAKAGSSRIIRAGTCGGMQPEVARGHLVIATAAVRADGLTDRLVPPEYPAVASIDVVLALRSAIPPGVVAHHGVVLSEALFYPFPVLGDDLARWQRAGVTAVEMEVAPLLVISALHGIEAGAILAVDGNPLAEQDPEMTGYDPDHPEVHAAVATMITAAFDALVTL